MTSALELGLLWELSSLPNVPVSNPLAQVHKSRSLREDIAVCAPNTLPFRDCQESSRFLRLSCILRQSAFEGMTFWMPIISRWYSGSFSWLYTISSSSAKVMRLHFCPAADSLAGDLQSNTHLIIYRDDHGI